jgi:hypothetical protein
MEIVFVALLIAAALVGAWFAGYAAYRLLRENR